MNTALEGETPRAETIYCDDCGQVVEARRLNNGWLKMGCDCAERSIKVDAVLPEGWER